MIIYLVVGSLLAWPAFSTNSTVVQVDLVFPRNNGVYVPTYPFPIVFALHNFSRSWRYRPVQNWQLTVWQRDSYWARGAEGSMGWNDHRTDSNWGPPADVALGINASLSVATNSEAQWSLQYEFRIGPDPNDCSGLGFQHDAGATSSSNAWFHTGRIFFNVSNTTGIMPDITHGGACSVPLGAVRYLGQNETDEQCPLLSWPRPNPTPCAFKIDSNAASQVAPAMMDAANCKKVPWPRFTSYCPTLSSASRAFAWNLFIVLLPTLLSVFYLA